MLSGKKSIIVGAAMVLYAGVMYALGDMPEAKSGELLLEGLAIIALRLGIKKAE